jgi:hypothetical protein
LTARRIHRHLVEEGYQVGERTVCRYLAERRRHSLEVYIPLIHRPGDEAQVDFFEVTVQVNGVQRKVWKFLIRLMYSGRDFVQLYDRCDQICFLDGHVRSFAFFQGVPHRLVYDNLRAAVKRIVGLKERELSERFEALKSHYLFEPCFARPGEGHDKGGVESRGKSIRLQHLTPIVEGRSLDTISAALLADIERHWGKKTHEDGRKLCTLFEEESPLLLPLPERPFEARRMVSVSISRSATVKVEGATYSLPERWARLEGSAWIGVKDIRFVCRGEEQIRERSLPGHKRIVYRDYLRELSRKPQAVRQVAPELVSELGEPYKKLWSLLEESHGEKQAARILAGVLGAITEHGEAPVAEALNEALTSGSFNSDGAGNLLALKRYLPAPPVLTPELVPPPLRMVEVQTGRAADYDLLLAGGAL